MCISLLYVIILYGHETHTVHCTLYSYKLNSLFVGNCLRFSNRSYTPYHHQSIQQSLTFLTSHIVKSNRNRNRSRINKRRALCIGFILAYRFFGYQNICRDFSISSFVLLGLSTHTDK